MAKTMESGRVMIGVTDIMRKMGIGRDKAYDLIKSKQFYTIKLGTRYLVHEEVFEDWMKGRL
ncbi:DNA-binding protein [Paenibacillus polymyxa]|uniref:helix-turn-helix domain-containing protein n=1 Tax=Paenibacillus TaxID=44249 RepID=UPI0006C2CB9C|nr:MULTISPECIES: helix-turn-helix domain-containing protein [Paenibacillus]APB73433.1 DNA-binding protein [Paenibacillus polymyxa]KOS00881.1 hypothetical protein AM598_20550 [Paenibacillus polymyxa]PNQ81789.1 DNA-binding protein [Paenibacillus sp. F4]